ncbi:uncharacterized protein LOC116842540 [Odontomachus brunneus]|uniref:uncharacterized protein LOC116842540 n=1 Tax=Odontomachus brunneus TaxID=486640 RepID=UPI0013F27D6F|nr:uncharacterized protein LOC116842540 [Odontomachus brunneus]
MAVTYPDVILTDYLQESQKARINTGPAGAAPDKLSFATPNGTGKNLSCPRPAAPACTSCTPGARISFTDLTLMAWPGATCRRRRLAACRAVRDASAREGSWQNTRGRKKEEDTDGEGEK